ncbi:GNAT family N-acetyltransferase [Patescibacteria group bacterium]|nr:GNAT family N-acetyltransferase [Patescibacteria group bacterium]MBU1449230.1 GNAT family N-acetyltransferase [Patescibacteria group bacterium]MBU2594201.1 GNAT family N-acetyltransferase [Candidatus Edwardsbacteria bacterium]
MAIEVRNACFAELESGWRAIEDKGFVASPFLTYDWLFAWWNHFGDQSDELILLGVYNNGSLVGIAPLHARTMRLKGVVEIFKVIYFIGSREINYADFILHSDCEKEGMDAIWKYLRLNYPRHIIYLCDMKEQSLVVMHLPSDHYSSVELTKGFVCPTANLPGSWDEYLQQIGKRTKKNIRQAKKYLENIPGYSLGNSSEKLYADALFRLHYKRWGMNPDENYLARLERYERDVISVLSQKNRLRFNYMKFDERIGGVLFAYDYGQVRYFHKIGHDPDFADYSPGKILIFEAIKDAISKNIAVFDFLRGDEDYKKLFTNGNIQCWDSIISNNRLRGFLFKHLK